MNYNRIYKLNSILGFSDESIEKIIDFFIKISRFKIKLSKDEKNLCQSLGIDKRLAIMIKSDNSCEIKKLPQCNEYGEMDFNDSASGICALFRMKKENSTDDMHRLLYRKKLAYAQKGYNLFFFETENYNEYYLALSKKKTDIDVLRWRKTNGINHDIDNDDLIAKIEEWKQKYDLVLWGCGRDWLHIFFIHEAPKYNGQLGSSNKKFYEKSILWDKRTPKFNKFANEVIEFCPDLLTQVYGTKKKLIEDMKRLNGVYFWWD
jgi:hypothetical protein